MASHTGDEPGADRSAPASGPTRSGGTGRLRDALRTTPALIVLSGAVLVAALAATAAVAVQSRTSATTLGERSAATAVGTSTTARQIYQGLADADVAASAVFLLPPAEERRAPLVAAYDASVHEVERTLTDSMGNAVGDPDRLTRLATIAARLKVYRDVVCAALRVAGPLSAAATGNRQPCPAAGAAEQAGTGSPAARAVLASAYAREASHYMSTELLTAAQGLWNYDTRLLLDARADARPWLAASVLVPLGALAALVVVQVWLRRRTRRRLNAGLLLASVATTAVLAMLVSSWWHWPDADRGFPELERAIDAQSATQQRLGALLAGRADVYLGLGASVDPAGHKADFDSRDLCSGPAGGREAPKDRIDCTALEQDVWPARQIKTPDAFRDAVDTVLAEGSAGRAFVAAEDHLLTELTTRNEEVTRMVAELPEARRHLGGAAAWVTLLAAAGVVAGLRQRHLEYQ
ncbi:hypothetical protein RM555_01995 [Micromonospora sp. DSM 115977]|uniref:Secreted protein n=1 Tax=Micromonospora reichwaldensis TaxID=3075516 RepID=A0ABU2WPF2_9ACTN|nr:hypothetical protein [Micromonospora sp. DSM 115977]MDT0527757.1 hypothetical protein [Micromonospora sp. DSM 115977]